MNTPYFSIILPMYNVERYIKICLDSILNQTFKDFEIIIVDDCSTDNSYKICQELYGNNKKVRLFRQDKNSGPGAARNTALKNAQGEYIMFVDGDDAIFSDALEKLKKATEIQDNIDAIHLKGWYETTQNDDKPLDMKKLKLYWEDNPNVGFLTENIPRRLTENWATNKIGSFGWMCIYRRKFLVEHQIEFPTDYMYSSDHHVIVAALCFAKKYLMVHGVATVYRVRPESIMHNTKITLAIKTLPVFVRCYKKIFDKVPELNGNDALKEQCLIKSLDNALQKHARPLYNGVNIDAKLDKEVYEALLPIFGENTTLVKYLFHGYNNMWRQANILAQQNYLLRQREDLIKQQNKLIEQLQKLLDNYYNKN